MTELERFEKEKSERIKIRPAGVADTGLSKKS